MFQIAREMKYIVVRETDIKYGMVGELIDTFRHPDGRLMYTIYFNDGELRGYYYNEIEEFLKVIK